MIYHVRHPALQRSGLGVPPPVTDENSEDGILRPPGTACAATSAALAHVQGNRSGHLINASPMSYPLPVRPLRLLPGARTGFVRNV